MWRRPLGSMRRLRFGRVWTRDEDGGVGAGAATSGVPNAGGGESGGESITLADIKVGDAVRGSGSVKGGVFVPTELVVMERGPRAAGDAASGGKARPSPNPNPQ